ncbi:uncharacterized protein I303_101012 [Kwoniella dejecticola CBS 10117]|uniref:PIPK domain-containing protein n=1 Tax=Kwoniella dejecticola CBS 10117 TaxID=1296121 RepID=A0AAJ8KI49_9TREE
MSSLSAATSTPSCRPTSPTKQLMDPLHPIRSSSPPLPPRKNAFGLPSSYLNHLRRLLRQWLKQQTRDECEATLSPTRRDGSSRRTRLWSETKVQILENALWEGAVVSPMHKSNGRKQALLSLDWPGWIEASSRRKATWKESWERNNMHAEAEGMQRRDASAREMITGQESRKSPFNESWPSNGGTLKTPDTATPSRPSSEASSSGVTTAIPEAPVSLELGKEQHSWERERQEKEGQLQKWCTTIRGLKGYQQLSVPKADGWEVVEDDYLRYESIQRDLPGAFPQSSFYDCGTTAEDQEHFAASRYEAGATPEGPNDLPSMIKPVICLHYPSTQNRSSASTSTLRLKRDNSIGKQSVTSISSSSHRKWWSGSGGRLSETVNGSDGETDSTSTLEVEFVAGQYVLPLPSDDNRTLRPLPARESKKKRRSILISIPISSVSSSPASKCSGSSANGSEVDRASDATDEDNTSIWSGTQKGHETVHGMGSTFIVTGAEDDVPTGNDMERVGIVGGTIMIRGVTDQREQKALHQVLQYLLYTLQSMFLELDLQDAVGVPRESDSLPTPEKPDMGATAGLPNDTQRVSVELHADYLHRGKGGRDKGFFHRFRQDTKQMWEGLVGKRRASASHEEICRPTGIDPEMKDLPVTPLARLPHSISASSTPPATDPTLAAGLPMGDTASHPIERNLSILTNLEGQLHSATPGLSIPMPPLLLRLREEHRVRHEKAKQQAEEKPDFHENGLPATSPRPVTLSSFRLSGDKLNDPLRGRALSHRLGGDVRAGLTALMSNLDRFEGWIKLQRLELLYSEGLEDFPETGSNETQICRTPRADTYVFWEHHRDISIQQVVKGLQDELAEDNLICPRPGCTAAASEHNSQDCDLEIWSRCRECGNSGTARQLTYGQRSFSWGKLLELLIYTDKLRGRVQCSHVGRTVIYLRTTSLVISLAVESVNALETRLPKLQVGPNVNRRKGGQETVEDVMKGLLRKEAGQQKLQTLSKEIGEAFDALEQQIQQIRLDLSDTDTSGDGKSIDALTVPLNDPFKSILEESIDCRTALLNEIEASPPSQVNNARIEFAQRFQTIAARLEECKVERAMAGSTDILSYLPKHIRSATSFALPGSSVIVRLEEPTSIIAYTLSCFTYLNELIKTHRHVETTTDSLSFSSIPSTDTTAENPTSASSRSKDVWVIEAKRRDTPRDLLSLRTLMKKKSEVQLPQSARPPLGLSLAQNAPPSLELSLEQVEGRSQTSDRLGDLVKTISKATAQDPKMLLESNSSSDRTQTPAGSDADAISRLRSSPSSMRRTISDNAPPSAFRPPVSRSVSHTATAPSGPIAPVSDPTQSSKDTKTKEGWGSVSSTISSSFNQLLRIGSDVGGSIGSIRVKGADRSLSSLIGPLGMMATADHSLSSIDEKPHLHFTYTLGERLRLSCTVYYATAFDSLRRRCAIDKSLIQSLSATDAWDAQGGKSKAAFFMTHDKRYIVKELVSKWNVSDTHALLEIAPAYFDYLSGTHNKATSLAKILGLYTVRIQDLKSGSKRQLDLLVMENLFYKQTISRTYDLKGIEDRRANKAKAEGSMNPDIKPEGTLFDEEWLEGLKRGLVLLQPHAKRILHEAISLDTKFLSAQSVMDYSLLIGVDEEKRELVVGLVDAIGSYNLFKTIESRGKLALNRGGNVTIIPPDQYRDRFEQALKNYFIACPDKWSKPFRKGSTAKKAIGLPSAF